MSVATELTRLQAAKANIKTSIENKGVTVSSDALLDAYPALIDSIPTGGGAVEEKDVNFYDYDGTLLYSYTLAEAQALEALPDLPDHSDIGLDKDSQYSGWNWTLAGVNALTDKMNIGANYDTTDSNTHVFIELSDSSKLTLYFKKSTPALNMDWGDGSAVETLASGVKYFSHTYPSTGAYELILSKSGNDYIQPQSDTTGASFSLYDVSSGSRIPNYEVQDIVKKVFWGHDSISDYNYSDNNNIVIMNESFSYTSVEYVSIPQTIKHSTYDTHVTISNSLQKCRKLKALILPPLTYGNTFLEECNSLKLISFPVESKVFAVFDKNYSLEKVFIKTSSAVGTRTICNAYNLKEIGLDDTDKIIYEFKKNYTLCKVKFPSSVTSLPANCFEDCYLLSSFEIPALITSISNYCFKNCYGLRNVVFNNSLTSIGNCSFYYCSSLSSIEIPDTITSIGNQAFYYCTALTTITMKPTTPPTINSNTFQNCSALTKIYVPSGTLAAYQAATNWSDLASIMEELS